MKRLSVLLAFLLSAVFAFSQNQYEVSPDRNGGKIYKGIISRQVLESDTGFTWFARNYKSYSPNNDALEAIKKNKDSLQFILFMGTWCEDSHYIVPKFFGLTDAAGVTNDKISILGTDRGKKTLGQLSEAMGVTLVPTIIVTKNGKELGRVVEYGKTGMFDKDLAQILSSANR